MFVAASWVKERGRVCFRCAMRFIPKWLAVSNRNKKRLSTIPRNKKCLVRARRDVRPLAFHATWNPTFNISPISNITFHVARFLRDSLYASNIRYNGLHLFGGSYGHAGRPDPA